MTHHYITVTYSVKSDCSRIGVPFTKSKKAEAERIFISTFFRLFSTLSNFDFEVLLKISIRFDFFTSCLESLNVGCLLVQFISKQID